MRECNVMGLKVKDYPLKEGLEAYRELQKLDGIHFAAFIGIQEILNIVDNKQYKKWFKKLDFVVIPDSILGEKNEHKSESKGEDYLNTILRSYMASKDGIYLLCDTNENLEELKKFLLKYSTLEENEFNIVGEDVFDEVNKEAIYNRINVEHPGVILSSMEMDMLQYVMMDGRHFLNASMWMGLMPYIMKNVANNKKMWAINPIKQLEYKRRFDKYEKMNK